MKTRFILLLFFFITACDANEQNSTDAGAVSYDETAMVEKQDWMKYLSINRDGYIDTVYREMISLDLVDSVYEISYKTKIGSEEVFTEAHRLPIGQYTVDDVKLLDVKTVRYNGKKYIIYKLFYDEPNASDEEMLYFFEPTYGFIIDKYAWWGNYNRLIDVGDQQDDKTVFFLGEMILFDGDFFMKYQKD